MKIYARIRFYWGAFVISSVVALGMIPLIYLFPKRKGEVIHKMNALILKLIGAKVKTFGKRDEKASIYLINHQSIIDIIALEAIELTHFRWIAKKELFDTPWFGRLLKKGEMIKVDRDNKAGLRKLIKDVKISIEEMGRMIAVFPEGTRASGQELLEFKAGPKFIAEKFEMRVQPIVVVGSKWILNEHNKTAHSGEVKLFYLESFDIKDAPKEWYDLTREKMQSIIDREFNENGIER